MTLSRRISCAAFAAALAATGAHADVSAADVWNDWKSYMTEMGYAVTGSESQAGATLTISDVVMALDVPDSESKISMVMGRLEFTDNGDGTVTITMPGTIPVDFDMEPDSDTPAKGTVTISQTSPSMRVSGDPDDLTYTFTPGDLGIVLTALEVKGTQMVPEQVDFSATMTGVTGITRMQTDDARRYDQQLQAADFSYSVDLDIPGPEGMKGTITGGMADFALLSNAILPIVENTQDLSAMLKAGLNVTGTYKYASGRSDMNLTAPDGTTVSKGTSGPANLDFTMSAEGLGLEAVQTDFAIEQMIPQFPVPISAAMKEMGFNFAMPTQPSDDPQDFALGIRMGDLTIDDTIWGMFDPAGQLPRDPITVVMDLTGTAKLLLDIFDSEAMAGGLSGPPGELNSLTIGEVLISAVGATVQGMGAFTFDNTDMSTFNGMPRPEGSVDLEINGANALIDRLVNMGLLPEDQAMGARMMMGLFTVPKGDDQLTSKIEINEQGHVLANGQRLQ